MNEDENLGPTWAELWQQTGEVLGDRAAARWLCEVASATSGTDFLLIVNEVPTVRMVGHLDAMVARHRNGEPLQYVLGQWAFRRLDLAVDRRVLIPRPETETLVELALEKLRRLAGPRLAVDLGTGSGAIGLALADELPIEGTEVWLTDVSEDALDVARANLAGLGRAAANVRLSAGSWFDALPSDLRADVIVSNPPYVAEGSPDLEPQVAEWEPAGALFGGVDGLDHIRLIVQGATSHLREGGWLLVEIGSDQGDAARDLLVAAGFGDVEIRSDPAGHDRVAAGSRPSAFSRKAS